MRRIFRNKRAISLVLSYVLLVLIAFTVGTMVYAWLKTQRPAEFKCNEGVSFTLDGFDCYDIADPSHPEEIRLTIDNKGRFDIDGFSVKASEILYVKPWANLEPDAVDFHKTSDGMNILKNGPLESGDQGIYFFSYSGVLTSPVSISVQAIRNEKYEEEELTLICEDTLIIQEISC